MRVQTPQAFATDMIIRAHQKAAASGNQARYTDDAMVAEAYGVEIATIAGDEYLAKITFAQDLTAMRQQMTILNTYTGPGETRTGSGFDVHKFTADTSGPIMICGVAVPHEQACLPIQMAMLACMRYVMRYLARWEQAILAVFSPLPIQNGKMLPLISFCALLQRLCIMQVAR